MRNKRRFEFGPATLVAAAFIGPGTVVTATLAGANFGYALLWALLFSIAATIVLQEMAARLGIVTQKGLGESIASFVQQPWLRYGLFTLILLAVVVGNSVYQGGNLSGARLGLVELIPWLPSQSIPFILAVVAGIILWAGHYRLIERVLIALVAVMSFAFLATFVLTQPVWSELWQGLLQPSIPTGATLTVIALIGTTVVPYNLFLHASAVAQKWHAAEDLRYARRDIWVSVPLGGIISMAIVASAASAFFGRAIEINSAADMSRSLQPLFGDAASLFMAVGLFSAGLSSALTAPLAAAYALAGMFGFKGGLQGRAFRATWLIILVIGTVIASLGWRPIEVIWVAQIANGLLLPLMAAFLIWACNRPELGQYRNAWWQNAVAVLVWCVALALGVRSIGSAVGLW
ncbi:Nramp family divalent metal transporter [Pseudidiomarina taiwanensis]|uniref:Manganese transporter n=1 Tax=Pseudidiomarina taiwanensis TaxID=337250 RepID=A0A432ZHP7_9GAMM|nr:Nramp family divalent metal transporter [Pseudidiomarina taiwanensis]RUO76802.1 manganese transporter [Pseudidiomarina taiwanensis]